MNYYKKYVSVSPKETLRLHTPHGKRFLKPVRAIIKCDSIYSAMAGFQAQKLEFFEEEIPSHDVMNDSFCDDLQDFLGFSLDTQDATAMNDKEINAKKRIKKLQGKIVANKRLIYGTKKRLVFK